MSDGTRINSNITDGDFIFDEDIGGGVKMPASKLHTGDSGVDGGPVTENNPLPVVIPGDVVGLLLGLVQALSDIAASLQSGEYSINPVGPVPIGGQGFVGSNPVGAPVYVGGIDTLGKLRSVLTDTLGRLNVVGPAAAGAAIALAGNPALYGLSDGTYVRVRLGDASGRAMAVGAAATGSTVANAGNPIVVAGSDGTSSRSLRTDTAGELYLVCDAAPAAVVPAAVNVTAGADPQSKVRTFLTDTIGKQQITELGVEGQLDALIDRMDQMLVIMKSLSGNTTQ